MIRKIIKNDAQLCNGCGGLEDAARRAIQQSGKFLFWQVVTITADGQVKDR